MFRPRRYRPGNVGSWSGHLSFARDLVDSLRPSLIVELGTHLGESYFGFCQSVEESGVSCACYAIDTWRGDAQAGAYDEAVFQEVSAYNAAHYARFSRLLRTTFDDALPQFGEGSIELLHIDGLHTYEAVRHDFETWFPKVRPGGIVLLHDTAARHDDFGVWRLWSELSSGFRTFEFTHSWGLGILQKPGGTVDPFIAGLFSATAPQREFLRHHYAIAADLMARVHLDEHDPPVRLQMYPSMERGYDEGSSRVLHVEAGEWTTAAFLLAAGSPGGPLRFDPAAEPCQVSVKELTIRNEQNGEVLCRWSTPSELAALAPQSDVWRLPASNDAAVFLCTGRDPQLSCPVPDAGRAAPLVVEIRMRVDRDLPSILASLRQAFATATERSEHVGQLEEEIRRRSDATEGELRELTERERQLERSRERERSLESELNDCVAAIAALERETARQADALTRVTQDAATYVDRLARRDEFVRTLQHQLSDRQRTAAGLLQKLTETQVRAQSLEATLRERDAAVEAVLSRERHRGWAAVGRALPLGVVGQRSVGLARQARLRWKVRGRVFAEVRSTGLFDASFYVANYPDVAASGFDPLTHYVLVGAAEGRQPNRLFDPRFYASRSPEVSAGGLALLLHYARHGAAEGRPPHPLFDPRFYVERRPGVPLSGALAAWVEDHGRSAPPHPLLDLSAYAARYPDVVDPARALDHYLRYGARERRLMHPLFDAGFYLEMYPDVATAGWEPLTHYVAAGAAEGRQPHPLFDTAFYLSQNPAVARSGMNPLVHYVVAGGRERCDPHPWFDTSHYLGQCPEAAGHPAGPLGHYLLEGGPRGLSPHPGFDAEAYLDENADVRHAGVNPLVHFLTAGVSEGRIARPVAPRVTEPRSPASAAAPLTRLKVSVGRRNVEPTAPLPPHGHRTVVCLSHVYPWPAGAGNEYRIARLLRSVRRAGTRVVLIVSPIDEADPAGPRFDATADEVDVLISCTPDGRVRVVGDAGGVLKALEGRPAPGYAALLGEAADDNDPRAAMLLGVDRTFCHDALISVAQHVEASFAPCVLLAEYVWMTRLLPLCRPETLRIIDTIDVWSTKAEKVLQYGVHDLSLSPAEERSRLLRGDLVLAIQAAERDVLAALVPEREVITAGVDVQFADPYVAPDGQRVVLVASDNQMNRAGLRDFLRFAWPVVRREAPSAELHVIGRIGSSVPPDVEGVVTAGWVEDIASQYARARLAINPAIAGTGLKIKTVEALAHHRAVVSWPNGLDGLGSDARACCLAAEDWYDFAQKVIAALREAPDARFSEASRAALAAEFSDGRAYGELHAWLDRAWARLATTEEPTA